jgi:hypothetical protein
LDRYDGLLCELRLAAMSQRAFIAAALDEGKVIYESK